VGSSGKAKFARLQTTQFCLHNILEKASLGMGDTQLCQDLRKAQRGQPPRVDGEFGVMVVS
jgi:hypothetical protein